LRHLYASSGVGHIRAYCHERKADRTFRFDRIISIIDADGVVYEAEAFFRDELKIDWAAYLNVQRPMISARAAGSPTGRTVSRRRATAQSVSCEKPGLAQRRVARDGTRVLTALARADGHLHAKELAVIMAYIEETCEQHGVCMGEEDRAALVPYLKRQRPDEEVLDSCLEAIAASEAKHQKRFLEYTMRLADADGILANEEFRFLAELRELVAA
jgi:hypothetical protein